MPDSSVTPPAPTMNRGAGHDQPPALPGVPPLAALLQGRITAAAHYASLLLQTDREDDVRASLMG